MSAFAATGTPRARSGGAGGAAGGMAAVRSPVERSAEPAWNACASSRTVWNRSAGAGASAFRMAWSSPAGTLPRTTRRLGGGSVNRLAMIAWAVGPVNGGSPASISYTTAARL